MEPKCALPGHRDAPPVLSHFDGDPDLVGFIEGTGEDGDAGFDSLRASRDIPTWERLDVAEDDRKQRHPLVVAIGRVGFLALGAVAPGGARGAFGR